MKIRFEKFAKCCFIVHTLIEGEIKARERVVYMENELKTRLTVTELVDLRERLIVEHDKMYACKDNIQKMFEAINAHDFVVLKISDSNCYEHPIVKSIDQRMWFYMVRLFNLEKYMLCTEYKKLESQICDYDFPEFTLANAEAWLSSVKLLVYENVQKMIEDDARSV